MDKNVTSKRCLLYQLADEEKSVTSLEDIFWNMVLSANRDEKVKMYVYVIFLNEKYLNKKIMHLNTKQILVCSS